MTKILFEQSADNEMGETLTFRAERLADGVPVVCIEIATRGSQLTLRIPPEAAMESIQGFATAMAVARADAEIAAEDAAQPDAASDANSACSADAWTDSINDPREVIA